MVSAVLGKEGLVGVIRGGIKRAAKHGFTFTGPMRLFLELCLLFGSGFDEDVQYPWARESLGSVHVQGVKGVRDVAIDAAGPDAAYAALVDRLVSQVTRDLQSTWERRRLP